MSCPRLGMRRCGAHHRQGDERGPPVSTRCPEFSAAGAGPPGPGGCRRGRACQAGPMRSVLAAGVRPGPWASCRCTCVVSHRRGRRRRPGHGSADDRLDAPAQFRRLGGLPSSCSTGSSSSAPALSPSACRTRSRPRAVLAPSRCGVVREGEVMRRRLLGVVVLLARLRRCGVWRGRRVSDAESRPASAVVVGRALGARKQGWPITKAKAPPGRRTRPTAWSVAARSGMSISLSWQVTTSNEASSQVASVWASSWR